MSDTKELTFYEKTKLWWHMHVPWADKSDLAKGTPDKKNFGPMAFVTDGMPHYYPQKFFMVFGYVIGTVMFFLNDAVVAGNILVMPRMLFAINAIGTLSVLLGTAAGIQFLYDSHRGTFDAFTDIWQPWRVFDLEGHMRQDVNRILSSRTIWSPKKKAEEDEETLRSEIPA